MGSRKIETFDVSPKIREILEHRYVRRMKLREEYLRETLRPTRQKLLMDSAVERFANMRALHDYRLKVDGRGVGLYFACVFGAIFLLGHAVKTYKMYEEHQKRTGQISYADRVTFL